MFIPASSEFVALCQAQVAILTQGLGAASGAVYLTEELVEGGEAKLIPVVVYPEATIEWEEDKSNLVLPGFQGKIDTIPRLARALPRLLPQISGNEQQVGSTPQDREDNLLRRQRQIVLPLIHESVVMGLLVTGREDRPWNERERSAIERIARTIAIAYIMDQRRVWVEQQLNQTRLFQDRQRERLDDLLHQFRNPLTAVRTLGKLILKRLLPGDKNSEAASGILRESDRLQELLQQFDASLDMKQEELAPLTLPAAPIAETAQSPAANSLLPGNAFTLESFLIGDVLEPLIVSAQAIAQERNLQLQSQIPTDLPQVWGNAKALREVLSNLIDNALKYTPAGGQIDIRVGETRQTLQKERLGIAISDSGPGIPPQDLEHLFERHYRGVQASTAIPGTGLGLAIAKELVEQMQGEIEVYSPAQSLWTKQNSESATERDRDNLERGTTFVVWLTIECPKPNQ
jgi:signal transduction histidine kinase